MVPCCFLLTLEGAEELVRETGTKSELIIEELSLVWATETWDKEQRQGPVLSPLLRHSQEEIFPTLTPWPHWIVEVLRPKAQDLTYL